jgi:cell division protein FtsQ
MDGGGCFMPTVRSYRRTTSKRHQVQRISTQKRNVQRFTYSFFLLGFFSLFIWGYFYTSTLGLYFSKAIENSLVSLGFKLDDVVVEGRIRTDKAQILSLLNLRRGKPLLSLDLAEAKEKLEKISWVKSAQVKRQLPNTLFIRISEKEPISLWHNKGKTYLMDRDGELVETKEPHKYKGLPIITGDNAPQHMKDLMALLEKFAELKSRVTAATHLRASRWDLRLDDKVDVKLPEKEAEQALTYLLDLAKHQLIQQEVMTIDMRLPGKLILRLTPEAAQRKNKSGKDV